MKLLIKPSIVLGAIAGAVFGVLLLIPFVNAVAFLAYGLIGAGVVFYLKRNSFVGILSIQDGALIGAISGFIALISSMTVFLPIQLIINIASKTGLNIFSSFIMASYSLIVFPMFIFFIASLSALFNAFSGLVVAFIYEKIENQSVKDQGELEIFIDQE